MGETWVWGGPDGERPLFLLLDVCGQDSVEASATGSRVFFCFEADLDGFLSEGGFGKLRFDGLPL